MSAFLAILPYALAAGGAAVLGGALAAVWMPQPRVRSWIQHFAAGVVIAAVAVELLPQIERMSVNPWLVLGGFALGGGLMVALKWITHRVERGKGGRKAFGLAAASGFDCVIDGLIIGAAFSAGRGVGVLLTAALGLEVFFLALSVGSEFRRHGMGRLGAGSAAAGLAPPLLLGTFLGAALLSGAGETALAAVLAFGAAALLYLVTEELLVEGPGVPETLASTAVLFLGFLALLAFRLLGPHGGHGAG